MKQRPLQLPRAEPVSGVKVRTDLPPIVPLPVVDDSPLFGANVDGNKRVYRWAHVRLRTRFYVLAPVITFRDRPTALAQGGTGRAPRAPWVTA